MSGQCPGTTTLMLILSYLLFIACLFMWAFFPRSKRIFASQHTTHNRRCRRLLFLVSSRRAPATSTPASNAITPGQRLVARVDGKGWCLQQREASECRDGWLRLELCRPVRKNPRRLRRAGRWTVATRQPTGEDAPTEAPP